MARKGAFGVLKIGVPATPAAVAELRRWSLTDESTEIDTTVMGSSGRGSMIPGARQETLEADLFFEDADAVQTYLRTNVGSETLVELELYPTGEVTGEQFWSASGYVMNYNTEAAADGAIEVNGMRFVTGSAGGAWAAVP